MRGAALLGRDVALIGLGSPMQVLGLKPDATPLEVARAYNRKRYENRNNASMLKKLEAAQGALVMRQFQARIQVQSRDFDGCEPCAWRGMGRLHACMESRHVAARQCHVCAWRP